MGIYRSVVEINSPAVNGTGTNTFHFRTTSESDINDDLLLDIATESLRGTYDGMKNLFSAGTVFTHSGEWLEIDSLEPRLASVGGWSVATASVVPPLPPATALVLSWRTALASRSGRGRTFLSPLNTGVLQDNGTPTEEARATFQASAENLFLPFNEPGDGAFVVWSPTDNVGRDFTGVSVANVFAVLRSRRD